MNHLAALLLLRQTYMEYKFIQKYVELTLDENYKKRKRGKFQYLKSDVKYHKIILRLEMKSCSKNQVLCFKPICVLYHVSEALQIYFKWQTQIDG